MKATETNVACRSLCANSSSDQDNRTEVEVVLDLGQQALIRLSKLTWARMGLQRIEEAVVYNSKSTQGRRNDNVDFTQGHYLYWQPFCNQSFYQFKLYLWFDRPRPVGLLLFDHYFHLLHSDRLDFPPVTVVMHQSKESGVERIEHLDLYVIWLPFSTVQLDSFPGGARIRTSRHFPFGTLAARRRSRTRNLLRPALHRCLLQGGSAHRFFWRAPSRGNDTTSFIRPMTRYKANWFSGSDFVPRFCYGSRRCRRLLPRMESDNCRFERRKFQVKFHLDLDHKNRFRYF